jgi:hypothetical protein
MADQRVGSTAGGQGVDGERAEGDEFFEGSVDTNAGEPLV